MLRAIIRLMFYFALLALSMTANVYLHELGHFGVADAFNLDPSMHFTGYNELKEVSFTAQSVSLAYVRYAATSGNLQDFLVALAGPMTNVLLAVMLAVLYLYTPLKEKFSVKFAYFMLLVPTLMAVISNLIPVTGSDGWLMVNAISTLF